MTDDYLDEDLDSAPDVIMQPKRMLLGILLALLLGGIGLFYASFFWGALCLILQGIVWLWILGSLTVIKHHEIIVLVGSLHILTAILAVTTINLHNQRLIQSLIILLESQRSCENDGIPGHP